MPAWVFDRINRAHDTLRQKLVVASNGRAGLTFRQTTSHFLCSKCEARFGECEDWVSRHSLQADLTFPLRDFVLDHQVGEEEWISTSADNRISHSRLAYLGSAFYGAQPHMTGADIQLISGHSLKL